MTVTNHTTAIPKLGVGAVIRNHNDEILLVKRNRNPEKGHGAFLAASWICTNR